MDPTPALAYISLINIKQKQLKQQFLNKIKTNNPLNDG